jgi:hypothetical protein
MGPLVGPLVRPDVGDASSVTRVGPVVGRLVDASGLNVGRPIWSSTGANVRNSSITIELVGSRTGASVGNSSNMIGEDDGASAGLSVSTGLEVGNPNSSSFTTGLAVGLSAEKSTGASDGAIDIGMKRSSNPFVVRVKLPLFL